MCGFIAQLVEHRTCIMEVPLKPCYFQGFSFPIAWIGKFTAMITLHFLIIVCFSCRIQDFVNVEKASPDQMNSNVIWGYTQKRSHFFAASATRRLVEVIISANIWRLMTMKEKKPASIKVLKKIVLIAAQNFFKWTTMMAMVSMSRIEHFHFQILAFHFWNHLFGYQNFHDFVYTQIISERKQFSNTLSIKCF